MAHELLGKTVGEVYRWLANKLQAVSSSAFLDARYLISHALSVELDVVYSAADMVLSVQQLKNIQALFTRRLRGEPIAYILGVWEFWSLRLHVNEYTLIPRPETEVLVAAVLDRFDHNSCSVLEWGTGSGAIAVSLATEREGWQIHALDKCEKALSIAKFNALEHGCKQVCFQSADWYKAWPEQQYDVIISNPPYVAEEDDCMTDIGLQYEPKSALVSPGEGLEDLYYLIEKSCKYLRKGGYLYLEHGSMHAEAMVQAFNDFDYTDVTVLPDCSGHARVTYGRVDQ